MEPARECVGGHRSVEEEAAGVHSQKERALSSLFKRPRQAVPIAGKLVEQIDVVFAVRRAFNQE
jgi:hypothetical protein